MSDVSASEEAKCISDFELVFKVSGFNMVFDFEQWLEAESSYVVEEWGMGTFTMKNMTFTLKTTPYINQEKMRIKIQDFKMQMPNYKYELHTKQNSQFQETLEQFSTVFAEHMKTQVNQDLGDKLATSF